MNHSPTETVIEPTDGWHFLDWKELWAYRDLLWLLVWRDLSSRYKQTVLGPLWFVIQPLMTTIVFTVVFGKVAKIPTDGIPPSLFYLCGLLAWNYFALNFQSASSTLSTNASLFGKVYFPRIIMPLSAVISNLAALAVQLLTFAGVYIGYKFTAAAPLFGTTPSLACLPLIVLLIAALSMGTGLVMAALTAKFRDFSVLAGFIVQLWLYATPVIYPLSRVPEKWQFLVALNPMTMPVELFRHMLLATPMPDIRLLAVSTAVTLFVLTGGILIFRKTERSFVDVI